MRIILGGLLVVLALLGCSREPSLQRAEFIAMGTLVNLSFYGEDAARVRELTRLIQQDFEQMNADWHPWQGGALGQVNQQVQKPESILLPEATRQILQEAQRLSDLSDGLFNPTLGGLVKLWGFHQEIMPTRPPSADAIKSWLQSSPSMNQVHLSADFQMRVDNPALVFDLGGFAKGYAVDKAIAHLRAIGVKNAIVNAGGDLRAIGSKGGQPWVIGIRHPRGEGALARVEVQGDESVYTSGDYERFFEFEGRRYHHILDPRTGYPTQGLTSVTILHNQGALSDAAATALMVAGPKDWSRIAARMGLDRVMVVKDDGTVQMSAAMQQRIQFEAGQTPKVEVVALP